MNRLSKCAIILGGAAAVALAYRFGTRAWQARRESTQDDSRQAMQFDEVAPGRSRTSEPAANVPDEIVIDVEAPEPALV